LDAITMYLAGYDRYRAGAVRFVDLDEALWRERPHGLNSLVWLFWHVARFEDVAVSRFVCDLPQLLDDPTARWPERMRVTHRHWGTFMPSEQVTELTVTADVGAVRAYWLAVGERVRDLAPTVNRDALDDVVGGDRVHEVLVDEGVQMAEASRVEQLFVGWRKADFLIRYGLTHSVGHMADSSLVCGLLGVAGPF
jgi:DinB family protein